MMSYIDPALLILLVLGVLGFISHNNTVTIAVLVLIIFRLTPLSHFFPWLQSYGLTLGIIVLTISVMAPIASGKITVDVVLRSFLEWKSLLAILVGIFVSWLGMRGVAVMTSQPTIISGLIIGTLLGVALFKGIPVGPLIAAGLLSLIIGKGS